MDFSRPILTDPIMGAGLALAITTGSNCLGCLIVSRGRFRLWINRRSGCVRCVWTKSAEPAPGDTRAHRHATGICDFPDWPADLAKNPTKRRMETSRSSLLVRTAHSCNADQGPN